MGVDDEDDDDWGTSATADKLCCNVRFLDGDDNQDVNMWWGKFVELLIDLPNLVFIDDDDDDVIGDIASGFVDDDEEVELVEKA